MISDGKMLFSFVRAKTRSRIAHSQAALYLIFKQQQKKNDCWFLFVHSPFSRCMLVHLSVAHEITTAAAAPLRHIKCS